MKIVGFLKYSITDYLLLSRNEQGELSEIIEAKEQELYNHLKDIIFW